MLSVVILKLILPLQGVSLISNSEADELRLTVSKLWIYFTWESTESVMSSGACDEPLATSGPENGAIVANFEIVAPANV